jgi:hypothetical protein
LKHWGAGQLKGINSLPSSVASPVEHFNGWSLQAKFESWNSKNIWRQPQPSTNTLATPLKIVENPLKISAISPQNSFQLLLFFQFFFFHLSLALFLMKQNDKMELAGAGRVCRSCSNVHYHWMDSPLWVETGRKSRHNPR